MVALPSWVTRLEIKGEPVELIRFDTGCAATDCVNTYSPSGEGGLPKVALSS